MIGFRGISDEQSREEGNGPTKEAQEATNLQLYERALQEQRSGGDEAASATFAELLAQPLLAEVDVVRAARRRLFPTPSNPRCRSPFGIGCIARACSSPVKHTRALRFT